MKKHLARIAVVSILCITYFTGAIIILHFLRPDYNPISEPTSRYAVGKFGFLMTLAFFSMSMGSFALVYGLFQTISKPAQSRIGLIFLGIWGLGVLVAMIFPIDLEGAPHTLPGTVHQTSGPLTFLILTAGVIMMSRRFNQDKKWESIHHTGLILSLVMLIMFIATFLNFAMKLGYIGLFQRIYLAVLVIWFIITAIRIRSISTESVTV